MTVPIEDRGKLIKDYYSDLIQDVTDANTFAVRIGNRWATDIGYGKSLVRLMETYELYRLDDLALNDFSAMIGKYSDLCRRKRNGYICGLQQFCGKLYYH